MAVLTEPFRWLFTAHFSDGSIEQTAEDVLPTSNQFKPVIERLDDLLAFDLRRVGSDEIVTVDLKTGAFIVNGTPMHLHEQNFEPSFYKLKLVYFREKREQANAEATVGEDGAVDYGKYSPTRSYVNRYFIGWQTTDKAGKNHQVTLAVG